MLYLSLPREKDENKQKDTGFGPHLNTVLRSMTPPSRRHFLVGDEQLGLAQKSDKFGTVIEFFFAKFCHFFQLWQSRLIHHNCQLLKTDTDWLIIFKRFKCYWCKNRKKTTCPFQRERENIYKNNKNDRYSFSSPQTHNFCHTFKWYLHWDVMEWLPISGVTSQFWERHSVWPNVGIKSSPKRSHINFHIK